MVLLQKFEFKASNELVQEGRDRVADRVTREAAMAKLHATDRADVIIRAREAGMGGA